MAFFKVLLIIIVPFSFGCIPSLKLYLGFKATPSSKKGISVNLYFFALEKMVANDVSSIIPKWSQKAHTYFHGH